MLCLPFVRPVRRTPSLSIHLIILVTVIGLETGPGARIAQAQSILFSETFEAYSEGATTPGDGSWSAMAPDGMDGFFEVREVSGDMVFAGQNLDGEGVWETQAIDISSFSAVHFSVHLTEDGHLEDSDYVDVAYSTDGGSSFTTVTDWNGAGTSSHTLVENWSDATVVKTGLSGNSFVLRITLDVNAQSETVHLDDVTIAEGPILRFAPTSETVVEGDGSTSLTVQLSHPDGPASADVVLDEPGSSADASDLGNFSTQEVSFSSPSGEATQSVPVSITDDTDPEGVETARFTLENASNALFFPTDPFVLTIEDNDASALLVSEVMPNPNDVSDADGEYVELYNTTESEIDLNGYTLKDLDGESHTIASSVPVPAGRYVVLCANGARASNGFMACDYEWSGFDLANGGDEVVLVDEADDEVDRVVYTDTWPFGEGQSMVYTGPETGNNNDAANWTGASDRAGYDSQSGDGADQGTPGGRGADGQLPVVTEIDGSAGPGWRMLSVPVADATVADLASQNLVQGIPGAHPGADPNIYTSYEGAGTDVANWTPPIGTSSSLTPGRRGHGFIWYFFDNSQSSSVPLPFLLEYDGGVHSGDVSVTLPADEEWHLLGNPYSFPFDLSGLTADKSFQAIVQVYDPDANGYQGITQTDEASETNEGDDVIAAHQGFFVQRTSPEEGDVTFTFDADYRIDPGGTVSFYKSERPTAIAPSGGARDFRIPLHLVGRAEDGSVVTSDRETRLVFRRDADTGWDRWDATKLLPLSTPFATVGLAGPRADTTASHLVRSLPTSLQDSVKIPLRLRMRGTTSGKRDVATYTLSWPEMALPDGWTAELVDRHTGAVVDLGGQERYRFEDRSLRASEASSVQWNERAAPAFPDGALSRSASDGSTEERLFLRLRPRPLPVSLTAFRAVVSGDAARLTWTTEGETDNAGFHVEHRPDPEAEFASVGFVDGHGTTPDPQQYTFVTQPLSAGRHVFRLRQVDVDGTTSLSDTAVVKIATEKVGLTEIAPNPVRHRATVTVHVLSSQRVHVGLYDVLGRQVRVLFDGRLTTTEHAIELNAEGLSSGIYFVRMRGEHSTDSRRVAILR